MLFDASSLIYLLKLGSLELLKDNYIQWLTVYEATNALWKEATLINSISLEEASNIVDVLCSVIDFMKMLSPHPYEREILTTASKLHMSVYDASYLVLANRNSLTLVTEDRELKRKAQNITRALSLKELIP